MAEKLRNRFGRFVPEMVDVPFEEYPLGEDLGGVGEREGDALRVLVLWLLGRNFNPWGMAMRLVALSLLIVPEVWGERPLWRIARGMRCHKGTLLGYLGGAKALLGYDRGRWGRGERGFYWRDRGVEGRKEESAARRWEKGKRP